MNFLKGRIAGGVFRADEGTTLPLSHGPNGGDGKPVVYGVRPEHFMLAGDGLPAKVHVIEPTGSETQVMAEFAGGNIIAAFRERISARPGETIRIAPDPMLVHVFDAETGRRLAASAGPRTRPAIDRCSVARRRPGRGRTNKNPDAVQTGRTNTRRESMQP